MTAAAAGSPGSRDYRDASPREVRAALIPEEVGDFDRQWRAALADAADALDLTRVFETLDSWRRRATITRALGPDDYRRMLTQAEHTLRTGEPPVGTVTNGAEEVRALVQERLGRQLYRIRNYPEAQGQIAALPDEALESYAQVLGVLELVPWNGKPYNEDNPDGSMRQVVFGARSQGYVTYLILEDQQLVDVLRVLWLG